MKAGLAKGIVSPKTKAIVLGPVVVAQIIARELEMLGFESVVVGKPLLPIASPGALDEVRTLLSEFSVRARGLAPELTPYVHPGVSAWAERSELAVVAQELGLNIICPPARILSLFNNRLKLLVEAEQIGVPNLAIGFDPISSIREIEEFIESKNQRFPFVLKSVKGCSGFDLFVVQDPSELDKGVALWIEQLRRNCGEVLLFTERYLEGARHVVVPFVRFKDGSAKFFSSIDASLQCRHRKVIEFCPAVGIDLQVEQQIRDWSMRFIEHCDYVGVGSLEFLVDGSRAFLINAVARLNTSFRLWELVDGTQAVAW
jgi:pyruvate carboxylase